MTFLRNKKKLAALNKENCEELLGRNLAQNSNVPRSQEDYITQVSEEIEGRVTKKLSQGFSRTENRILGALFCLDDFVINPLIQSHSGTAPEPLQRRPGMHMAQTRERMSTTPRVILIRVTLAQKMATTGVNGVELEK